MTSVKVANSNIADAYVSISGQLFIKAYKVGTTTIQVNFYDEKRKMIDDLCVWFN